MSLIVDLDAAAKELDLDNRLRETPPSASIRGIFFRILEDDLARRGFKGWPKWKEILGEQPRSYRLYAVRDLMVAYARGAALVSSDPRQGIRGIFRGISAPFSQSWFGRAFRTVLHPNPLDGVSKSGSCAPPRGVIIDEQDRRYLHSCRFDASSPHPSDQFNHAVPR